MKTLLCFVVLLTSIAWGEEGKHIRFIPLGERPVWKGEDDLLFRKEIRYTPEPVSGSMPPSSVVLFKDASDGVPLKLRLNQFTDLFTIKPTAGGVKIYEGKTIEGKPWVSSAVPARSHSLGVLYRDHTEMSWSKPKMMMLSDDLASFPLGKIRFVNTSQIDVAVKLGDGKAFVVPPGKLIYKPLEVGETPALIGVTNDAETYKAIYRNSVSMKPNQRVQVFFYKAQGENPKSPIKILIKPESSKPSPAK